MEKRNRKRWFLPTALVLILLCALVFVLLSIGSKWREKTSRPLVLITSPNHHQVIMEGDSVIIHAAAREQHGINRIEVWADDELLVLKENDQGNNPQVINTDWLPKGIGSHVVVVRARSANGVYGQSSLMVTVINDQNVRSESHQVQEGETLESIAEDYGIEPSEVISVNREVLEDGDLSPGEVLDIPTGLADPDEPPAEERDLPEVLPVEPPEPEIEEPGTPFYFLEGLFFYFGNIHVFETPGDPISLKLEVFNLSTGEAYEDLHCYIGLSGETPRWYPDSDGDQSTDESFAYLGGGEWDIAASLAGDHAVYIPWTDRMTLDIVGNCVAVGSGGSDAIELGQVRISAPPEDWDGTVRSVVSSGGEAGYDMNYRISVDTGPHGFPIWLDPSMTPPTNLWLDDRRISLHWDYEPREDEEQIDGFRFYLNGNLQWVLPADVRETGLPYEWFNPPCGSTYVLTVSAYREGFPDGPESVTAAPPVLIEMPLDGCQREIQVTFESLETADLGGDGRYEDRTGDIGPVYGTFFANEKEISFDGRSPYGSGLDLPLGLYNHWFYDLFEMVGDPAWSFSGMPSFVLDLDPGDSFEFGFRIMDEDSGRCNHSGDRGCDDLICEGLIFVPEDSGYGEYDRIHTGALISDDGRCRVNFTWQPAFGSPVGTGVEGWEPKPWIGVEAVEVLEDSGAVRIYVRNSGTATWPWIDLQVVLQTRDGERLAFDTWEEFVLEPGQEVILSSSQFVVGPPYDVCVVIDPNDLVLEEYESRGTLVHQPVCTQLPDLTIQDVVYDPSGGGRLRVSVQNIGDYPLVDRTLEITTYDSDGNPLYLSTSWPVDYMGEGDVRTYDLTGVTENRREAMQNGYQVVINPNNLFAETNNENNRFEVGGAYEYRVWWISGSTPLYGDGRHYVNMDFRADVVRGGSQEEIITFHAPEYDYNQLELDYVALDMDSWFDNDKEYISPSFTMFGDEALQIRVDGEVRIIGTTYSLGQRVEVYDPDSSSAVIDVNDFSSCYSYVGDYERWGIQPPQIGLDSAPPYWYTSVKICRRNR